VALPIFAQLRENAKPLEDLMIEPEDEEVALLRRNARKRRNIRLIVAARTAKLPRNVVNPRTHI